MNKLADYLITLRERRVFNQADLLKMLKDKHNVEISQSMLSAYEQCKKIPSAKTLEKLIKALEAEGEKDVAKLKSIDLKALKEELRSTSQEKSLLKSEISLLDEAKKFLARYEYQYSLWFIGNDKLLIANNSDFRSLWVNGLRNGVDYNVLLFVDKLNRKSNLNFSRDIVNFRNIISAIKDITEEAKKLNAKKYGKIKIYSLSLDGFSCEQEVENTINNLNSDLIEKIYLPNYDKENSYLNIVQSWQSFATISIYVPREPGLNPAANFQIANVTLSKEQGIIPYHFFWFDEITSNDFAEAIKSFERDLEKKHNEDKLQEIKNV